MPLIRRDKSYKAVFHIQIYLGLILCVFKTFASFRNAAIFFAHFHTRVLSHIFLYGFLFVLLLFPFPMQMRACVFFMSLSLLFRYFGDIVDVETRWLLNQPNTVRRINKEKVSAGLLEREDLSTSLHLVSSID